MRFSESQKDDLTNILSRERIEYWKTLVSHQHMMAWRSRIRCNIPPTDEYAALLHEWNASLAFAMMASLQIFELSIRNHMHDALKKHLKSDDWWGVKTRGIWSPSSSIVGDQVRVVQKAIDVSARRPKGVTSGGVISELSFGFWLALLSPSYDNPSAKTALW